MADEPKPLTDEELSEYERSCRFAIQDGKDWPNDPTMGQVEPEQALRLIDEVRRLRRDIVAYAIAIVMDLEMRPEDGGPYIAVMAGPVSGNREGVPDDYQLPIERHAIQPRQIEAVFRAIADKMGGQTRLEAWRRQERDQIRQSLRAEIDIDDEELRAVDELLAAHVRSAELGQQPQPNVLINAATLRRLVDEVRRRRG
jgi:hypothetical protein